MSGLQEPLLADKKKNQSSITSRHLDPEEAETQNVARLDTLSRRSVSDSDQQLERMHNLLSDEEPANHATSRRPVPRLASVARRVTLLQKMQKMHQSKRSLLSTPEKGHRKKGSMAAVDLLGQIAAKEQDGIHQQEEHNHAVLHAAGIEVSSTKSDEEEEEEDHREDTLPVVDSHYGSIAVSGLQAPRRTAIPAWKRCCLRVVAACCDPRFLVKRFYQVFVGSLLLKIGIPLFALAWVFYYCLGNPDFSFIPGTARASWLLNFFGRQIVTLELARLSQWLVLDCFLLGSRFATRLMGPFLTMTAFQSRGWPFVLAAWACWDLLILHGDDDFQSHWFYWTGWKIYSQAKSGMYILTSELYQRILFSMIVAGLMTTAKRMVLTVRFGRRMLVDFKPRLEKLLADMVLLSEIAELAEEAELIAKSVSDDDESNNAKAMLASMPKTKPRLGLEWSNVRFDENTSDASESPEDDILASEAQPGGRPRSTDDMNGRRLQRSRSGSFLLKSRLERWEEPENKLDKSDEATIQDVLKFKHALNYMDDTSPFGDSFGPATDRNECIESSHKIYYQLLKCEPDAKVLSFEVLALIVSDENGVQDDAKMKALRRLFQPDARNELTLLAFVQSCDTVYKHLRYFKASVSNASVIDNELERIANFFYAFLLILMLLAIMQFNPWPLLVSMTSLLVSVSFALGSSVSKYVEGILLIAVRRPFDLGDRILIASTDSVETAGAPLGWFVEDISLSGTTLRFSKTNEVATVSNFAISQSKIVNCQRSPSAVVFIQLKLHRKIMEGDKLKTFRETLEKYVRDHPRIWDSLAFCRHDLFGGLTVTPGLSWSNNVLDITDNQYIIFTLAFQHRLSWQSAARININRADLLRYMFDVCLKLGVQYDNPASHRLTIIQGDPVSKSDDSPNVSNPTSSVPQPHSDPVSQASFDQGNGVKSEAIFGMTSFE